MLTYYRYKVEKGMMMLVDVPEPYQKQLRAEGLTDEESSDPE